MKIKQKISNDAFFCLLFTVIIVTSVTGCYSLIKIKPLPELSRDPLTSQEKLWGSIIRESYPKWKRPVITRHQFPGNQNSSVSKKSEAAPKTQKFSDHQSNLQPQEIYSNDIIPEVNDESQPVIGRKIRSKRSTIQSRLPDAIMDINPKKKFPTSPSTTEGYRIVSDDNSSGNHQNYTTYRVKKGETLYKIARKIYGDESAWKHIFNANKAIMKNPNDLKPGIYIKIP